jgi:hypothetical protein
MVAGDAFRPLCPRGAGTAGRVENARAQERRDELQFIRRQALYETAGLGFTGTIGTRNQSGYQSTSQGRTPVGEKSYSFSESGRIMSETATWRKGIGWRRCAVLETRRRDTAV